jgi:restriction system protein
VSASDPSKGVDSAEGSSEWKEGLLSTLQNISPDQGESTRDGAPPVDLIDGDQLCDLLKQYELGVHCSARQIEEVAVDSGFFAEL